MKIVKVHIGFKLVYDTDDISTIKEYTENTRDLQPLHHTHNITDYKYLIQFFPENHSIFFDFGNSFYYVL